MKIYEIIAKEMEKKPEERSFHFKQIEKYLKKYGFSIWKGEKNKTYFIIGARKEAILSHNSIQLFEENKELFSYLSSNRETLRSDNTTYHNILVSFYKHNYVEYLDLKNAIMDKMQKIFHNNMPFLYNNCACHEIKFQFSGWGATISKAGGTSCAKEYADEWNNFMQTKWGEEVREMTKDDLKTGMVVETRDGYRYLVLRGSIPTRHFGKQELMLVGESKADGFVCGDTYNKELKADAGVDESFDIIACYAPEICNLESLFQDSNEDSLIWKRKSVKVACLEQEIAQLKAKLKEAEVELEKERGK